MDKVEELSNKSDINITLKKSLTDREQLVFEYFLNNIGKTVFAKDLAELLLKNPDFDVQCVFVDTSKCSAEHFASDYYFVNVCGIADIGYSDKVIVLDTE